ncbi:MAG: family 20 glycosylhydrolase [Clostridia bacterium]|nr:family 20 glycosylhydrolase [Clostridia bacterium]
MKIKFNVDKSFQKGIERLQKVIGYEIADSGIELTAVQGNRIGTSLKDGKGTVYYSKPNHFFRELGVFVQNASKSDSFDITEDSFFETTGLMLDSSRGAVHTVDTVCSLMDYLAVMGYNLYMLYTEDMVEIENRPYFGYMRGAYTKEDIRAIDDYAYDYGIEVIPCVECYGHMAKYLVWDEASAIKDTASVLLAKEEKTFEFLDELIQTVSSCVRSKRIHIGMDEAWDMGRGNFLTKHGYVPPIDIFNEYMDRLIGITQKYGLSPMMWSDMYFRANSESNAYYDEDVVIPEETKKAIPGGVELVFWHYGEKPGCDDYMLKRHKELNREVIYAGGLWSWSGHFPEHNYSYLTHKESIEACRKHGVNQMMTTMWLNDNAECDVFANLFGLSFVMELCYSETEPSRQTLKERFEFCTGGSYDAFYLMSKYHNKFSDEQKFENYEDRFLGKSLFWQDILQGTYDANLFGQPMSEHYRNCRDEMKQYVGKWDYLYDFAVKVFDYLAIKCEIAEKLYPSYQSGDKQTLKHISDKLLPSLKEAVIAVHSAHRKLWFKSCKTIGWSGLDLRYGGVVNRCDTVKMILDNYLSGASDFVEELEIPRYKRAVNGFAPYYQIMIPTINIKD